MQIELEKDVKKLKNDIKILEAAMSAVISSPEFRSLFGKTQFLDTDVVRGLKDPATLKPKEEWTDRRTRGDHSINVAAVACRFVEKYYNQMYGGRFEELLFSQLSEDEQKRVREGSRIVKIDDKRVDSKLEPEKYEQFRIFNLNKRRAMVMAALAGYAHDLGHTPFGHDGEDAMSRAYEEYLDKYLKEIKDFEKMNSNAEGYEEAKKNKEMAETKIRNILEERNEIFGDLYEEEILGHDEEFLGSISFQHIEQSYINFLNIINREEVVFPNELLEIVKWAILAHSRSRIKELPDHIDNRDLLVVYAIRTADKGDYQITDGAEMDELMTIRKEPSFYAQEGVGIYEKLEHFINDWVDDIVASDEYSDDTKAIEDLKRYRKQYELWAITYCELHVKDIKALAKTGVLERVLRNEKFAPKGTTGVFKADKARNKCIVKKLTEYYLNHYEEIPEIQKQEETEEAGIINKQEHEYVSFDKKFWESIGYTNEMTTLGFITSLTNSEARKLYVKLVGERIVKGPGYGIEPIEEADIAKIKKHDTWKYITAIYKELMLQNISPDEREALRTKIGQKLSENKRATNELYTDREKIEQDLTEIEEQIGIKPKPINAGLTPKGLEVSSKLTRASRYIGDNEDKRLRELMEIADKKRQGNTKKLNLKYPNMEKKPMDYSEDDERDD